MLEYYSRAAKRARYEALPDQKKRRAGRNAARRIEARAGRVHKGDGLDVDHTDHDPSNTDWTNLVVMTAKRNRSKH